MTNAVVSEVDAGSRRVARRVVVPAAAADVFALVVDPHRHPELDGSGTVRDTEVSGPDRLEVGSKFSVGMKQYGVPYTITSTVTGLEEDSVVEWQHPLGHRWRWELEELAPASTQVTETFDYRGARSPRLLEWLGEPAKNAKGITATLEALATRFGS